MSDVNARMMAASAELIHERIRSGHRYAGGKTGPRPVERAGDIDVDESVVEDFRTLVDAEGVEGYLAFQRWPDDEPLPDWLQQHLQLIEYVQSVDRPEGERGEQDVPFVELFSTIVEYSRSHFAGDVNAAELTEDAVRSLEDALVDRLVDLATQAVHLDFITYVVERDPAAAKPEARSADSTDWYDKYVSALFDGRVVTLFERFPVLARLVVTVACQWGRSVSRFISRLSDDREELRALLSVTDLGPVTRVDPAAGDPHDCGQSVLVASFETGPELVYKPRSVRAEEELYGFETWLAEEFDDFPELQTPAVLSRPSYGWVERVSRSEFTTHDEVTEYYWRTGTFLAATYLLNVKDCHYENVVAGDVSPVLVDAETVLQSNISATGVRSTDLPRKLRHHVLESSLLGSMLLPFRMEEQYNDRSGIGMVDEQPSEFATVSWSNVNTDAMDFEYAREAVTPEHNHPVLDGEPVPPGDYVDAITAGFGEAYDIIESARDAVARRVTEQFDGVQVRYVFKDTVLYQALLETLATPKHLEDGMQYSHKILETLSPDSDATDEDWRDAVFRAEQIALTRRDVPRFTTRTDATAVECADDRMSSSPFERTGLEQFRSRIDDLNASDKTFQQALIRDSLGAYDVKRSGRIGSE